MSPAGSVVEVISIALAGGGVLLWLIYAVGRGARGPHCPRCAFDLAGHATPTRCPECGYAARSPRGWMRRERRRWLARAGGALLALAYVVGAAPRTISRGVWGVVPTPVLVLTTLWDDPRALVDPEAFPGTGRPASWREEMERRREQGELAGWKGRVWLWRTSLAHPIRTPSTDPDEIAFESFACPRGVPGDQAAMFVMSAVNPQTWILNGGVRGRLLPIGGRLAVRHGAKERAQIARLLDAVSAATTGPVFASELDGPAPESLARTREIAARAHAMRWTPPAAPTARRELLRLAARELGCDLDLSFATRSERAQAYLDETVRAPTGGLLGDVLDEVMSSAAPDAGRGWTIRSGLLCPADGSVWDESRYFAAWPASRLPGGGGERDASRAIDKVQRVNPDWWPEFGGDACFAWAMGDRVVILGSPQAHAVIERLPARTAPR